MSTVQTALNQDVNQATGGSDAETPPDVVIALPFERWAAPESADAIQLDSCRAYDEIVIRTHYSVYELIVLSGDNGDVFIRGGRAFPEFRRARFIGSTSGGSALKVGTIDVGRHMELVADGKRYLTSTVQAISRNDAPLG